MGEIENNSKLYLDCVEKLPEAVLTSLDLPTEAEELEESCVINRECPFCGEGVRLKVLNTSDYKKMIYCDIDGCTKKTTGLGRQEEFLGCTSCRKFDICLACHAKEDDVSSILFETLNR